MDFAKFAVANAFAEFGVIVPERPRLEPVEGPKQCCADFAAVLTCDGETDFWQCWVCGNAWSAPCR